ncbi:hypothetical protein G4D82_12415 [Flavobacterium sp. CYK-4]|uniref:hypothetical protein n=1 Tax=Flavobacterium lotistagni TaxID=2709660 RepID=UPI0014097E4E|nr:hypothetical protein [Flavobacterium lotistagni]NHM08027.1 hypothetical protein [Flavobacterium lotistagni]
MDVEINLTHQGYDTIPCPVDSCSQVTKTHQGLKNDQTPMVDAAFTDKALIWFPLGLYLVLSLFQCHYYRRKIFKPNSLTQLNKRLADDLSKSFHDDRHSASLLKKERLKADFLLGSIASTVTITKKKKEEFKAGLALNYHQLGRLRTLNAQMIYFLSKHNHKTSLDIVDQFYERVYQNEHNKKIQLMVEQNIKRAKSDYKKPQSGVFFFHLILNFLIGSICFTLFYYGIKHEKIDFVTITLQTSLLVIFCLLYKFFRKF